MTMETDKTVENARRWLSKEFPNLKRKAQLSNVLPSSPVWDNQPKSTSFGNSQEEKLTTYIDAKTLTQATYDVLDVMSDKDTSRHATLLKLCFKDELDDVIVMERLCMSHRWFYQNKRNALIEFADLFEGWFDFKE